MPAALSEWEKKNVCVITCDGRMLQGLLIGFDQLQNLILNNAQERVYQFADPPDSTELEIVPLGLYVVRGDNVAIVSDVVSGVLEQQEENGFEGFQDGEPLKPVMQFRN